MSLKTPISIVKHLGSAKSGTTHHIHQRVTALFLIPLMIWFVVTVIMFMQKNVDELPWFITSATSIVGACLFVMITLYHGTLGIRMVIEDYIHCKALKSALLIGLYGLVITTIVAGLVAILTINFSIRIG